ncbi:peptide chain release factor N(5)-glutamine methyltransferase [Octadecabacter ascidiaceicola]|uniref:Release factor glutamine methyltransferase n=1 Tax=Octadecabacter ascidiaceicola TaxID=1655543 RepID=A0A238JQ70_9RHOB|nr:peptide chain release factor N(5)-glutamine methyltransferase [Octadecabacter ascidiaceicola]SMX31906.1 Release factor glutamine methyltransferase [Octadecabacter ascidiaceicola]
MSEADLLAEAKEILKSAGIENPVREARQLWEASFPRRYVDYEKAMSGGRVEDFRALVARRAQREPMSHLTGCRDFYEHRFEVSADVLDPRPDTEALVIAALEKPFERVLDLGTGSGCILLSLLAARKNAIGFGTDLSEAALNVAKRNFDRLELAVEDRANFLRSDWFQNVEGTYDLIVSNPPYIASDEMAGLAPELSYEPRMALTDEGDGLSCYRIIAASAPEHLNAGGWLMVEIGLTQGAAVRAMFEAAGLQNVEVRPDLDGRDRVVVGQKPL